jgi:hypothetical protein
MCMCVPSKDARTEYEKDASRCFVVVRWMTPSVAVVDRPLVVRLARSILMKRVGQVVDTPSSIQGCDRNVFSTS